MNKVTLMALGMYCCSLCCSLTALPYFIYGPADDQVLSSIANSSSHKKNEFEFCSIDNIDKCEDGFGQSLTVWPAYIIIWLASFINGIGYTALTILGIVFVDDNVKKAHAPMYMAGLFSIRLLGPTIAYLLSSYVLSLPEDPTSRANYSKSDPRFIGAWWIGFLFIGTALFIFSTPLLLFPGELTTVRVKRVQEKKSNSRNWRDQLKEVKISVCRLLDSKIWVCDTLAGMFNYISGVGYGMLLPKYLETQYHKSASFMTGAYKISSSAAGMLIGGFVISWLKPKGRKLAAYLLFIGLVTKSLFVTKIFLGCPQTSIFQ